MHRHWKQAACEMLKLQPGGKVLDVCTGTGDLAAVLSHQVGETGQVEALDFSAEMLAIGRQRFSSCSNIRWVEGDALALPYADNTFDGAIISFGLRNVASVPGALAEMVRVIRPGGRVINLDVASDVRNPLFWFYFSTIMPRLGKWMARDPVAYSYLCQSARAFQTPQQLGTLLTESGLVSVFIRRFGFGSVALQVGVKPKRP